MKTLIMTLLLLGSSPAMANHAEDKARIEAMPPEQFKAEMREALNGCYGYIWNNILGAERLFGVTRGLENKKAQKWAECESYRRDFDTAYGKGAYKIPAKYMGGK